jgi:hypothetical protein
MTKKLMVLAAAVGTASAMFGAGVASALPDLTGMTYSEAASAIQQTGASAQVSARVGDRLSEGDCLVTGSTKSATPPNGFAGAGSNVVLVALDCNGNVASANSPGYSAASPQGRKAIQEQRSKEWRASETGQAWCRTAEKTHPEWGQLPGC